MTQLTFHWRTIYIFFMTVALIFIYNIHKYFDDHQYLGPKCFKININVDSQCQTQPKLYLQMRANLGNVFFKYASLYGIARETKRQPVAVDSGRTLRLWKIMFPYLTIPFQTEVPNDLEFIKEQHPNTYENTYLNLKKEDIEIGEFFESWRYFLPKYEEELRHEFVYSLRLSKKVDSQLHKLTMKWMEKKNLKHKPLNLTYVGVQVRRGDKATEKLFNAGWRLPKKSFFENASTFFRSKHKNVVFVVSSDDMSWSRDNLVGDDYVFSELGYPEGDMALLGSCNHTLMSVGTFSWWAAWLAGGTAVYYKNHVAPGSHASKMFRDEDYFLPHWIPMTD